MAGQMSLEDIIEYFERIEWPLETIDRENERIFASYRGRNVVFEIEVGLSQEWGLLQLTLTLPEMVPTERTAQALALINRINYNLPLGHFELGMEGRQLSWYAAMPVVDTPFIQSQFETLIGWGADIVDEEHPRLMQVLFAGTPADEAEVVNQPDFRIKLH